MSPEAIRALLADPQRAKVFVENLLAERVRQADSAKRKRDGLLEQRKRVERDQARVAQVCIYVRGGGRGGRELGVVGVRVRVGLVTVSYD